MKKMILALALALSLAAFLFAPNQAEAEIGNPIATDIRICDPITDRGGARRMIEGPADTCIYTTGRYGTTQARPRRVEHTTTEVRPGVTRETWTGYSPPSSSNPSTRTRWNDGPRFTFLKVRNACDFTPPASYCRPVEDGDTHEEAREKLSDNLEWWEFTPTGPVFNQDERPLRHIPEDSVVRWTKENGYRRMDPSGLEREIRTLERMTTTDEQYRGFLQREWRTLQEAKRDRAQLDIEFYSSPPANRLTTAEANLETARVRKNEAESALVAGPPGFGLMPTTSTNPPGQGNGGGGCGGSNSGGAIAAVGGAVLIAGGLTWLLWPDAKETLQPYTQGRNDGKGYLTGIQARLGKENHQTINFYQTDGSRETRFTGIRWEIRW